MFKYLLVGNSQHLIKEDPVRIQVVVQWTTFRAAIIQGLSYTKCYSQTHGPLNSLIFPCKKKLIPEIKLTQIH